MLPLSWSKGWCVELQWSSHLIGGIWCVCVCVCSLHWFSSTCTGPTSAAPVACSHEASLPVAIRGSCTILCLQTCPKETGGVANQSLSSCREGKVGKAVLVALIEAAQQSSSSTGQQSQYHMQMADSNRPPDSNSA